MKRASQHLVLDVSASTIAMVFLAIGLGVMAAAAITGGQRVVSWIIACAIAAALMEIVVDWLDQYMRRGFAILAVLIVVAAAVGALAFDVFRELDSDVRQIQFLAPQAAHDIANTPRFADIANEIDLEARVTTAVDRLREPSSGLMGRAVTSIGTYTFCAILTVLFVSWGPRVASGIVAQLEPAKQQRARIVTSDAFHRARTYVVLALAQSIGVGALAYIVGVLLDLPAVPPLALIVAVFAFVPNIGIVLGSLPMLMFALAFNSATTATLFGMSILACQLASTYIVQQRIVERARLYLGPATIVIAALFGFELYGAGGAIYATAVGIMATAVLEAAVAQQGQGSATPPTNESPTTPERTAHSTSTL